MNQNKFYVYAHIRNDTNEIFYIGKGHGNRAYHSKARNKHWHNIVNKHGFKVEFIAINLFENDAFNLESKLIIEYGRKDLGTGKLVNWTNGGEGSSGRLLSNESKSKISKARLNKPLSEEHKANIKANLPAKTLQARQKASNILKQLHKNPEFREKLYSDLVIKNRKKLLIPVAAYANNNLIGSFESVTSAMNLTGVDKSSISANIKGKRKYAGMWHIENKIFIKTPNGALSDGCVFVTWKSI